MTVRPLNIQYAGGARVLLKQLAVLGLSFGLLTIFAMPAAANHVDSANDALTCSSSKLTVSASDLNPGQQYTIDYTITLTPTSGSPVNVTGSIPIPSAPANGTFSTTVTNSFGPLNGTFTASGTATLEGENTIPISFSPQTVSCGTPPSPPCTVQSSNTSNFNGTPIQGGDYIWFNANFTASGIPSDGATIYLDNSTISFTADKAYNLAIPNAQITFSPSATCSTTSYDSASNTFTTIVPLKGDDELFLSGLAFPVPASFANVNGKVSSNVVWNGTFGSDTPGVSINWKWGAAVYTVFSTNYNTVAPKAAHQTACSGGSSDHAGTPEGIDSTSGKPFKNFVTGGARGGGGSNWTGSWSGTLSVDPNCH
jgi:hypothetical protein